MRVVRQNEMNGVRNLHQWMLAQWSRCQASPLENEGRRFMSHVHDCGCALLRDYSTSPTLEFIDS